MRERFTRFVAAEVDRLIDAIEPAGAAELRRSVAGPLSVAAMAHALGLEDTEPEVVLGWYDAIVAAVTASPPARPGERRGRGVRAALRGGVEPALDRDPRVVARRGGGREAGGLDARTRWSRTRPCCCSAASRRPRG